MSERYRFKVTVIGDGSVGKTSLIQKFTQGTFQKEYIKTIGAQFSDYKRQIGNNEISLILWDIAGQDDFLFLRPTFYRSSNAAIIVFSLEENELGKRSFENIAAWQKDVQKFCGDIPVILLANKIDLIEIQNFNDNKIKLLSNEHGFMNYYITSALTGEGVDKAFTDLIDHLYVKYKKPF